MLILYIALDPRIGELVIAADRAGRHRTDPDRPPDPALAAAFTGRVAEVVGPGRVRRPRDKHPARAVLFEAEAYDVLERVVAGLSFGCARLPPRARAATPSGLGPTAA